jgi:hypothetical protein
MILGNRKEGKKKRKTQPFAEQILPQTACKNHKLEIAEKDPKVAQCW